VQFTDYACGYCRRSVPDVEALIAENPELRVVIREYPIMGPNSRLAAEMALAAAEQGRYAAFHEAMFAQGSPDGPSIIRAAQSAGLDITRAQKARAATQIEEEIGRNLDLARKLGIEGTPSWVIGDTLLAGAVGKDELAAALARARS
jgi:protein-disulfide isomerase